MKSKIFQGALVSLLVTLTCIYYSCKKEHEHNDDTTITLSDKDKSVAEENSMVQSEFEDLFDYVDEEASGTGSNLRTDGKDTTFKKTGIKDYGCVDTVIYEKKTVDSVIIRTITFVFSGSTYCKNGVFRKGKIIAVLKGLYKETNNSISVTFHNFYMKRPKVTEWIHVEGTKTIKTIEYKTDSTAGRKVYVAVKDARLTWPDLTFTSWQSDHTKMITVSKEPKLKIVKMWGGESGITRKGKNFKVTIDETTPCVKRSDCKWIVSGRMNITRSDSVKLKSRILDYGNGNCDSLATVILASGDTVQVILK